MRWLSCLFCWWTLAALAQTPEARLRCEELYDKREWEDAAGCYAKLYDENKTHPDAAIILFNLAIAAENAKQIPLAIYAREKLTENVDFAVTAEAPRSLFALARLYLQIGDFAEAAKLFERFANQHPGEADAIYALENAAMLREALGETEEAIDSIKKIVVRSKMKGETARAAFRIGEIRQRAGDSKKALAAYEQYIRDYGATGTKEHLLMAKGDIASYLWKDKKQAAALKQCREVVALADKWMSEAPDKLRAYEELNRGLDAAAECQFYLAEEKFEAFQKIKLPARATPQQLVEWLEATRKERESLSIVYLKIKDYGSKEWMLAALARIGMASYFMLDALGKTAANELTEPLRADAIKVFEVCMDGSLQSNWYNDWSSMCEDYLRVLEPERWPETTEWTPAPSYEPTLITPPTLITAVSSSWK